MNLKKTDITYMRQYSAECGCCIGSIEGMSVASVQEKKIRVDIMIPDDAEKLKMKWKLREKPVKV